MTDGPGQIGPYQVTRELGRGGMGVVYLATDTRLDREVAIKALPSELASDPARLERFEREAKTLAQLNHPNLAGIHGVEEQDGAQYLVLEYVEGESIADRLDRGPMPADEAVEIAIQIALGIEAAHDAGVIHRDLKPANIIVTPDGNAKVLDFGLARTDYGGQSSTGVLDSPTMTQQPQHSPTIAGAILGTAAYMSPEQARGRRVDKRTDIWSFGVVLYEMLVGASPFHGETATDSIGAVLHKDLELERLPAATPINVRRVLERCLVRDRNLRFRDIGDVRVELLTCQTVPEEQESSGASARYWKWTVFALAVVCIALIGAQLWSYGRSSPTPTQSGMTFPITLLEGTAPGTGVGPVFALSADGSLLVVGAKINNESGLWIRDLSNDSATLLKGTDSGYAPSFSPDGKWIAYFTDSALWKVSTTGGSPLRLADSEQSNRGLAWLDNERIVYTPDTTAPLHIINASGSGASTITALDPGNGERPHRSHRWPAPTPDGKFVVFTAQHSGQSYNTASIAVVELATRRMTTLLQDAGSFPIVLPDGKLIYNSAGTIFACEVDWSIPAVIGAPRPVLQNVMHRPLNGGAQIAVANNGTAIYISGYGQGGNLTMPTWLDLETGVHSPLLDEPTVAFSPRFSPDGSHIVWQSGNISLPGPLVVYEIDRQLRTEIPLDRVGSHPIWSPDGREIAFSMSTEESAETVHTVRIDGEAAPQQLLDWDSAEQLTSDWSRDGSTLLTTEWASDSIWNIGSIRHNGSEWVSGTVLATPSAEFQARLSPDGKWIAYSSDITGDIHVFIRRLDGPPDRQQISVDRGYMPIWAPDGQSVYFRSIFTSDQPDRKPMLFRVDLTEVDNRLVPSSPQMMHEVNYENSLRLVTHHDLHPDGKRLLYIAPAANTEQSTTVNQTYLKTNWFSEINSSFEGER
ncbi:MAG: protein kinase [Phycisphaerales bacterium]|nr:protein kinase [Phycisphaerales bacterium]